MDRFACITGADRGLGFELVKQLIKNKYNVFASRYLKGWSELERLQAEHPERLHLVEMDISDDKSVKDASRFIASLTDKLDILINNAAILGDTESTIFDELDFGEMQKVFNVNALGALRVSNSLIRLIVNSHDKLIVNISSEAGSISTSGRKSWFAYCMSKAALNMQSTIIHNHLKEFGGEVLVIHPGWMKTYMRGEIDQSADLTPGEAAAKIMQILSQPDKYKTEKPAFIDFLGDKMPW